ncbi:MAG: anaerobic ribonucleoside-triphosphate reductase [Candidatus Nezhaarchaeales archaeon]
MQNIADHEIEGHDGHHLDIHTSKTTGIDHIVCHTCKESLVKLQPCEVYSRCVGYLRPISGWNEGKRAEFRKRKTYQINQ